MDNKVTKERLNNHLEYDWFKYVLILIVVIAAFIFIFQQINADRENEQLTVFASCYEYTGGDFAEKLNEAVNNDERTTTYIRSLNIETQNPRSNEYATLLSTHGDITSDVLIVGKSYMKSIYQYSMLTWDDEVIEAAVPEDMRDVVEYWEVEINGKTYKRGIRLDNLKNIDKLFNFQPGEYPEGSILHEDYDGLSTEDKAKYDIEMRQYDSAFYLVINPTSYNIGSKHKKGKADKADVQTFTLVSKLLWYAHENVIA